MSPEFSLPREDVVRLRHMLEAAESAMRMLSHRARSELEADEMLRLAVVKAIEIVGEAAYKCSDVTTARLPHIPWNVIRRMRHRLVHDYFDINLEMVWQTVLRDLPVLAEQLRAVIPGDESP